jgi:hypothetical protein
MMKQLLLGLGSILLGVSSVWHAMNYPTKGRDIYLVDFKGKFGGFLCILIGLLILLNSFLSAH